MPSFFKKAMGLFIEFDDNTSNSGNDNPKEETKNINNQTPIKISQADIDKFEKHFDKLFEDTNLPGPDYFEFFKMMETLEGPIPDEKARISAVFASLSIQGLTKVKLLETADVYKTTVEKDKVQFEDAVNKKSKSEIDGRISTSESLQKKIVSNSEMIQKLTKEITEAQTKIATLNGEITLEQNRLAANKNGYNIACQAMLNKIVTDIQKIQSTI